MSAPDLTMPFPRALSRLLRDPEPTPQLGQGNRPMPRAFQERLERMFSLDGPVDLDPSDLEPVELPPDPSSVVRPTAELVAVTHRISGQFVDVMAMAARQLLGGRDTGGALARIDSALDALSRLATAAEDAAHDGLLAVMRAQVVEYTAARTEGRGHHRFRDALRAWLPEYAVFVGGMSGDRLRHLVEFDMEEAPVFQHLEELRGVGPQRLRRLYAAGLFTADAISEADPVEMAAVTGLPRDLSRTVVEATRSYLQDQRRRAVEELPDRIRRFLDVVRTLSGDREPEVASAIQPAFFALRDALRELEDHHDLA